MPSAAGVRAGSAYVELYTNDSKLTRGLRSVQAKVTKFGSTISSVGAPLAAVGTGVASLGAVSLSALAWPLKLASNLENAEAAFTTLLKDEGKARNLLKQLQSFAASTPFQFDELSDASKKLLAFGSDSENVQNELRQIGDIASAIGAPIGEIAEIYGKARVQGRLFAEDINQLTGRGIPVIQELAKQFGVTDQAVKKLVEDGDVSFANLERAFASLTTGAGQFAGGMERQSKTLSGSFSTLKDNVLAALRPFGQVLLPYAKSALQIGTKVVAKFAEWAEKNKQLVVPIFAAAAGITAIGAAAAAAGIVIVGLGAAISAVGTIAGVVGSVASGPFLAIAAAAFGVIAQVTAIGAGLAYVADEAGLLRPAIAFIGESFGRVFDTFQKAFGGVVNALKGGQFQLAAKIAWAGVKVATLQGTQQVLKGIDHLWNNAGSITTKFFSSLLNVAANAFRSLPKIAFAALRGGAGIADAISGVLSGAFDGAGLNLAKSLDPAIGNASKQLRQLNAQAARGVQAAPQRNPATIPRAPAPIRVAAARPAIRQPQPPRPRLGPPLADQFRSPQGPPLADQFRQLPTPQEIVQQTTPRPQPARQLSQGDSGELLTVNREQLAALRRLIALGGLA